MIDQQIRASDQDREDAARVLADAYAVGRLTRPELARRAAAVYAARTWGQLRGLVADLPVGPVGALCPAFLQQLSGLGRRSASQSRAARLRLMAHLSWILAFATAIGLAGLVIPATLWVAAVLIPATLLLPPAVGIGSAVQHPHADTPGIPPDRRRSPEPGRHRCRHRCRCHAAPAPPRGAAPDRGCHARRTAGRIPGSGRPRRGVAGD